MDEQIEERIACLERITPATRSTLDRLLNDSSVEFEYDSSAEPVSKKLRFKARGFIVPIFVVGFLWIVSVSQPFAKEFAIEMWDYFRGTIGIETLEKGNTETLR